MTSEEARAAILGFLSRQAEPVRSRDIVAATGVPYSQVYNLCNRLAYDKLVEKVGADQLARWVEHDGRQVRLSVESSAIGWRVKPPPATERQLAALAESWAQPAVEPDRTVEPRPVDAVGKMTRLMARLRGVAALVESPTVATELERIAAGLGDVRDDLVALIVDPPNPYQDTVNQEPPRPDYRRNRTAREKNPEPGKRRCSGPCGRLLPVEQFTVTDRRTGKRRADCRQCYNAGQRSRYVRAGYKIVTVEVVDGDPCLGHACPECGQPFEVGQLVQGENVIHATCREEP